MASFLPPFPFLPFLLWKRKLPQLGLGHAIHKTDCGLVERRRRKEERGRRKEKINRERESGIAIVWPDLLL